MASQKERAKKSNNKQANKRTFSFFFRFFEDPIMGSIVSLIYDKASAALAALRYDAAYRSSTARHRYIYAT